MSGLTKDMRIIAGMCAMGEKIRFGQDAELLDNGADRIDELEDRVQMLEAVARPLLNHLWTSSARLPTGETIRLLRALGDVLDSKPLATVSAEKEETNV